MSRQSRQVKEAKRRRARVREASRTARGRMWPYVSVAAAAVGIVGAFFLISAGGGSSQDTSASYPAGYTPPIEGDPAAPVEVVMFGDFQCPSCKRFETETLPALREEYVDTGRVRFVWRNFEHYGEESVAAARAAHCAGEQDMFWDYHDLLYRNQRGIGSGAFSRANLLEFADQLGLNATPFTACLDSFRYEDVLAADFRLGRDEGINGTPGFLVNGEYLAGAQPFGTFQSVIEAALEQAR